MIGFFTVMIVYWLASFSYVALRAGLARSKKGGTAMILLKIPRPVAVDVAVAPAPPKSLCYECVYSRIVRGFEPNEELITCGFGFPPRDIYFAVRSCTDFRKQPDTFTSDVAELLALAPWKS
jgi:hypothetical protein